MNNVSKPVADKNYQIRPTETEARQLLIESAHKLPLEFHFGPSGAWFVWEVGTPKPWYVERLEELRSTASEGMNGDGI